MKKILACTASLSLALSFNFGIPAAAYADNGNNGVVGECKTLAPVLGVSEGNCINLVNANGDGNSICHLWQGPEASAFFGIPYPFSSFGQCVSTINGILHQ